MSVRACGKTAGAVRSTVVSADGPKSGIRGALLSAGRLASVANYDINDRHRLERSVIGAFTCTEFVPYYTDSCKIYQMEPIPVLNEAAR